MESVHDRPATAAPISHQESDRPQPDADWPLEALATHDGAAVSESAAPETVARASAAGDLAIEYLGVADALARRFRCPGHDPEDLRQVARLGLMKAARRYRSGLGHGFVPYAVPTITGEIKRYLRDQSWIVRPPRGVQELRLKINAARPRLAQNLGHEPSTRELSQELCVCVEDIAEAQIADASMVPDSIEHGDSPDDPEARRLSVVVATEDPGFEHVESLHALNDALVDASEQDRELLRLRFVKELTQEEIAKELGVSQMQVSRLLRRLLGRLRRRMAA
jgi:RNA polymerase sigma-B factor